MDDVIYIHSGGEDYSTIGLMNQKTQCYHSVDQNCVILSTSTVSTCSMPLNSRKRRDQFFSKACPDFKNSAFRTAQGTFSIILHAPIFGKGLE